MRRLTAIVVAATMLAAACSSDDSSDTTTTTTESTTTVPDVGAAFSAFCESAKSLIADLDGYTGMFGGEAATLTVGQVKDGADELSASQAQVQDNTGALKDSIEQFNKIEEENAAEQEKATGTTSTTLVDLDVDDATFERVEQAEKDFDAAVQGISDDTPLADAEVEFQSAAYALQLSWTILLSEAGCLEEDQAALDALVSYTASLQSDLKTLGYFDGTVDGIYGTETVDAVKAFQTDNGLPVTGLPDPPTERAISQKLGEDNALNVASLQGLLKSLGFYDGPIDGDYNTQTEDAVKALQAELGVPQTGVMDPATWSAYADRRAGLDALLAKAVADATSTTTTEAPTTAAPTTTTTTTATTTSTTSQP